MLYLSNHKWYQTPTTSPEKCDNWNGETTLRAKNDVNVSLCREPFHFMVLKDIITNLQVTFISDGELGNANPSYLFWKYRRVRKHGNWLHLTDDNMDMWFKIDTYFPRVSSKILVLVTVKWSSLPCFVVFQEASKGQTMKLNIFSENKQPPYSSIFFPLDFSIWNEVNIELRKR